MSIGGFPGGVQGGVHPQEIFSTPPKIWAPPLDICQHPPKKIIKYVKDFQVHKI